MIMKRIACVLIVVALVAAVDDPALWEDDLLAALMRGVGLDGETVSGEPALYVAGQGMAAERFDAGDLAGDGVRTALGRLRSEGGAVTLDGKTLFEIPDDAPPLRIAVLDRNTGTLVRSFCLAYNKKGKLTLKDD